MNLGHALEKEPLYGKNKIKTVLAMTGEVAISPSMGRLDRSS